MSELRACSNCQTISRSVMICAGKCGGQVQYCSNECRLKHWESNHKNECSKIEASQLCDIIKALVGQPEEVSITTRSEIIITFQGEPQNLKFDNSSNDDSYEFARQYADLSALIKTPPMNAVGVLRQLRLVSAFAKRWGSKRVPARLDIHRKRLEALLTCPTYISTTK
jgi:hypothetical protein